MRGLKLLTNDDETAGELATHLAFMTEELKRIANGRDDGLAETGGYVRIHRELLWGCFQPQVATLDLA